MITYDRSNKLVLRRSIESGQYTAVAYTERLAEIHALPSIGSIGDCLLSGQSGHRDAA